MSNTENEKIYLFSHPLTDRPKLSIYEEIRLQDSFKAILQDYGNRLSVEDLKKQFEKSIEYVKSFQGAPGS